MVSFSEKTYSMSRILSVLKYLLSVHITGILAFTLFRIILYISNIGLASDVENQTYFFSRAMLKGLQFDNLIASYILTVPLFLLSISALFNRISKRLIIACNYWFSILYSLTFIISAADIPYFLYYYAHIGISALNWMQFGGITAGMILQEKGYIGYILLGLFVIVLFSALVFYFGRKLLDRESISKKRFTPVYKKKSLTTTILKITFTIFLWGMCFIGVRGTFERYPLRNGAAYFCNNSFYNQMGINPAFFFLKSSKSQLKDWNNVNHLMDTKEAIVYIQEKLGTTGNLSSPIARVVEAKGESIKANVVIILLESMTNAFLESEYNNQRLMPFLNRLKSESYYFENFYSAGIHTNNGIVSTLYGFPALFNRPSMETEVKRYTGIPFYLKKEGYQNLFFLTSNPQYDNMNSFLLENGFDRIYSQYDYPQEKVVNNFGVQDDFLLEYGLKKINEIALGGNPFFATFLTVSNHVPFIVPEKFKKAGNTDNERILAFVDYSLESFMEEAQKQVWFNNTFFIFLGDHGSTLGKQSYDMPLSYNQTPCFIYSPILEDMPKPYTNYGGQIDIFPTIMNLLNISYTNNSLGVDLLNENQHRPCVFFVNDNQLGCIDENYFYVHNLTTNMDFLYNREHINSVNTIENKPDIAAKLKNYAVSMIVISDYLIKNQLTGHDESVNHTK